MQKLEEQIEKLEKENAELKIEIAVLKTENERIYNIMMKYRNGEI